MNWLRQDGTRELQEYRGVNFDTREVLVTAKNPVFVRNFLKGYPERVTIQQLREHPESGLCHWEALDDESEELNARNGVST